MFNKGITMLQLVITIIIMVILASVAILYGGGAPKEANITRVYNEIKEVQGAINEANILGKIKKEANEINFFGETAAPKVNATEYSEVLGENASGDYYYLDFTSTKKLKNTFEIENVKNDYILDYNTMNIYIIKGVEITNGNETTTKYDTEEIEKYFNNIKKNNY